MGMTITFPNVGDLDTAFLLLKDYTQRHFPLVDYQRLLTTNQEIDDIHDEVEEYRKRWADAVQVRAWVQPTMLTQPMTIFGTEDFRKADFFATLTDLVAAGLATVDAVTRKVTLKCGIGDRFKYSDDYYSVIVCVPAVRWANTDIPIFYKFETEQYRVSSNQGAGPV